MVFPLQGVSSVRGNPGVEEGEGEVTISVGGEVVSVPQYFWVMGEREGWTRVAVSCEGLRCEGGLLDHVIKSVDSTIGSCL